MNDLSLNGVCQLLNKSRRTITRYIKAGKLKPKKRGNQYWFNESEVNRLISDTSGQIETQSDIVAILAKQLEEKDKQIAEMHEIERRLTSLLQEKQLLLENKLQNKGVIRGFIDRLFKRK